MFIVKISQYFQQFCGAEKAGANGYPFVGYTALRNVYDNLLLLSAALQKVIDFYAIDGVVKGEKFEPVAAIKLRKTTEFEARKKMVGTDSELPPAVIEELKGWDRLFDYETHGARVSLALASDYLLGKAALPVLPVFDESSFALFMNRHAEMGWMLHRLIPLLQPGGFSLSEAWQEKWTILDDSFKQSVESLTVQLGKPIGAAMAEFVTRKFPYNAKSKFPL